MEPQVTAEHYMITLTDDHGIYSHYKARSEVGDFINDINWAHTRHFKVEPVEPLAKWELELLNAANSEATVSKIRATLSRDELKMRSAIGPEPEDEWRTIESLPVRSFEINKSGIIRHRATKRFMEQEFDIDHNAYRTLLTINGKVMSIYGQRIANAMWEEELLCSNPQCNTKKGHDGPCPPWGWSGHEVRKTNAS